MKNRYDFNKWAIWMKMKMLSLVGNERSRGRLIDEAKREKIHWTVTLASNPHEMFLMSLKKRFSANHEIPTNIGCTAQEKAISTRNGKQTTRKREWREKKRRHTATESKPKPYTCEERMHKKRPIQHQNSERLCNSCHLCIHFMLDMLYKFTARILCNDVNDSLENRCELSFFWPDFRCKF